MRALNSGLERMSPRATLWRAAVRRGFSGAWWTSVLLGTLLVLAVIAFLFSSKPYAETLYKDNGMPVNTAIIAVAVWMILAGGLLGYLKGRNLVPWWYRGISFIVGTMITAVFLCVVDVVLKVSFPTERDVHFASFKPIRLASGVLYWIGLGLACGIVGFVLLIAVLRLVQRPKNWIARAIQLTAAVLLLPAAVYFLFLFDYEKFFLLRELNELDFKSFAYSVGLLALVATALIIAFFISSRDRLKIMKGVLVFVALVSVLFLEVEGFGLWFRNDDAVYTWMNRRYLGMTEGTGALSGAERPSMFSDFSYSPDGRHILRTDVVYPHLDEVILVESPPITWRCIIIEKASGRQSRIPLPDGMDTRGVMTTWSPDSRHIAGVSLNHSDDELPSGFYVWSYDRVSGKLNTRRIYQHLLAVRPSWSPDSREITIPIRVSLFLERMGPSLPGTVDDLPGRPTRRDDSVPLTDIPGREFAGYIYSFDADSLDVTDWMEVDAFSTWVMHVDPDTIIYGVEGKELSPSRHQSVRLVERKQRSGRTRALLDSMDVADIHRIIPPMLVGGGASLIVFLQRGSGLRPFLLGIRSGDLKPIEGLVLDAEDWDAAFFTTTGAGGGRALVAIYLGSAVWPHAQDYRVFLWDEVSGRFNEYQYRLTSKYGSALSGTGDEVLIQWDGGVCLGELPAER